MLDGKFYIVVCTYRNAPIGNYLELKNWIELEEDYQCFFYVVDMHSITARQESAELRKKARHY